MRDPSGQAVRPSLVGRFLAWVGIVAHVVVLFFYVVSGLVMPAWAVGVLVVIWAGLLAVAIALLRTRPPWTLVVPLVAVVVWFAVVSAGDAWLGWTA
ncbi:hypothetical protein SAMN05421812_107225 [Asanoa hainanensis]|uniref:DUF4175 domain-containing protein n=1 Tax=Asanoa hainanensis TaxID=560556 RepID=A0A239N3R3_9ACTN|nr:hypothetical protein [Asanoa hainanensis]SNT49591.1 hypothetical protein SAMN05421812_107225 [Asanoa hainanensis]